MIGLRGKEGISVSSTVFSKVWYTGQQADSLAQAAAEKGSLYLTDNPDFAAGYGKVYALRIRQDAKVFDTSDRTQVMTVVERLFQDYEDEILSYELRSWIERAVEWYGNKAKEIIADEISPKEIRNESAYDLADFQVWLWETFEFDVVTFWDEDTALLLNAVEMAVEVEFDEEE